MLLGDRGKGCLCAPLQGGLCRVRKAQQTPTGLAKRFNKQNENIYNIYFYNSFPSDR